MKIKSFYLSRQTIQYFTRKLFQISFRKFSKSNIVLNTYIPFTVPCLKYSIHIRDSAAERRSSTTNLRVSVSDALAPRRRPTLPTSAAADIVDDLAVRIFIFSFHFEYIMNVTCQCKIITMHTFRITHSRTDLLCAGRGLSLITIYFCEIIPSEQKINKYNYKGTTALYVGNKGLQKISCRTII